MTKVTEKRLRNDHVPVFICDFSPPKGWNPQLLEEVKLLNADFISVAYNPGMSPRVNSIAVASWIKENTGKDVIFTIATRDMNRIAIQSLLLGASLLGLDNMVVVKGDNFADCYLKIPKTVHDFIPTDLISSVRSMNESVDYAGKKLQSATNFCIGASVDLNRNISQEIDLTHKKIQAGAQFFLLQAIFHPEPLQTFLDRYLEKYDEDISDKIFCGIQIMSDKSSHFGKIPKWLTDDIAKGRSSVDIATQILHNFIDNGIRSIYLMPPILKNGRRDYEVTQKILDTFKN